ncbi:MAG: GNAT family N-acetyltransferase [Candidatus Odinarchaeota archaeon]
MDEIDAIVLFLEEWMIKKNFASGSSRILANIPASWKTIFFKRGYREKLSRIVCSLTIEDPLLKIVRERYSSVQDDSIKLLSLKECWNKNTMKKIAEMIALSLIDSPDARIGLIKKNYRVEETIEELKSLKNSLNYHSSSILMLKQHDGREQVAGICLVTSWEGSLLVYMLVVYPRYRNKGYATALLSRTISALKETGHYELFLFVTRGNDAALRVYEKLGFKPLFYISYVEKFF